ncbi:unnamed protein product [Oikopleura dioica]|uniref:Uncharacterized protein n=1 Tax=Oikopleura dioica TaxID=34765 RepID=E4XDC9_OIKDI|nr:unnamed protein product [Oikopleura dioica]
MRGRGHQECLEHIRGQFESLHGVTVTCGFTTDGKNVAGMAFWFSSIENYGAISCGELTYSNINTAALKRASDDAAAYGSPCYYENGLKFNTCASMMISQRANEWCPTSDSHNIIVSDPAYIYVSGYAFDFTYPGGQYGIAYCISR